MAADLIEKMTLIGADCKGIPETLGEPNGDYYHTESNYTYRLTDKDTANWILTFVCNDHGKIAHVFIRKSCCSVSQDILFWGLKTLQSLFIL